MKPSRVVRAQLVLLMGVLLLPAAAFAQTGAIGGSVTDETGGVLPGVTVEATSPALIEGVRSTVTDGAGLYTIEALRPGTYSVTFTLPGFSTFVREGIELVSDFTANVDGQMTVGSIEETVTVSGASPVIDVQNVVSQQNLSRETMDTLPTSRTYFGLAALTPGMTGRIAGGGHDVGGTVGDIWGYVSIHGASEYDGIVMWDGMSINNNIGTGGGGSKEFFLNQVAIEEMVISTSDMNAEYAFGGVATNAIPKEGANTFSYYVNVGGTSGDLQAANVDDTLQGRGASPLAKNRKVWDYGVGVGGPLVQDRVWFYTSHRWWGAQNFQPSGNVNIAPGYATDPGAIGYGAMYIADEGDAAWTDFYNRDNSIRFTIQASERHKFTLSQAFQDNCACHYWPQWGITDMAASQDYSYSPINLSQASWTFPASNRLLFEAGFSRLLNNSAPESNERVREDAAALAATGMTFEQFMAADPAFALQYVDVAHMSYAPLLNWRSHGIRTCAPCLLGTGHDFPTQVFRASMSYVTGSHNFKVGTDGRWAAEEHAEARLASNAWPIRLDFFTRDRVTGALGGGPGGIFLVHQFATPRASFQNSFEPADAEPRRALRPPQRARSGADRAGRPLGRQERGRHAVQHPAHRQRAELPRHYAAARCGVRPDGRRPHGAQGDVGQVRHAHRHVHRASGQPHGGDPDLHPAGVARLQPEPDSGLRPRQFRQPDRSGRRVRRDLQPAVRNTGDHQYLRPESA